MMTESDSRHPPLPEGSPLAPLRSHVFLVLWLATVISNIGTWMQNASAGWLMTSLTQDAFIVSLVQVATLLPAVVLGLPAGALADIVDRRRLLILVNAAASFVVLVLGVLVHLEAMTPTILLAFTTLIGACAALLTPSWQAIVPTLVERKDLQSAIALNSIGFNISRAVGPALAGLIIGTLGQAMPFWMNAATTLGIVAALYWWRPKADPSADTLPPERLMPAVQLGLRHALNNRHLKATLMRSTGFFLFASAYWALLPLVARDQIGGSPQLYGLLLGTIGAGAVTGAFALPRLKAAMGPDRLVSLATVGTAVALCLFGLARSPMIAIAGAFIAGVSWIAVLAPLNVSAQVALPNWVKGRGLSIFGTVQFGALTAGSMIWGQFAKHVSLPSAHIAAAIGALAAIPLLMRWKLQTGAAADLTPSMHWPAPVVTDEIEPDRGPVQVVIEYDISTEDREAFLAIARELGAERLRDGAYDWDIFEDLARPGRMVETFFVSSWLEHQRQHHRVTSADEEIQSHLTVLHRGAEPPEVRHLLAARPRSAL